MKNYVFKHPSNSLIQYYMYQPIEKPKPNSKNYSDIFIKHASPSRSPQATGTRLLRGIHGRPVPRLSGSPQGDQLLILPGWHGAVVTMLTDNPPVMFDVPLMLPLENYD